MAHVGVVGAVPTDAGYRLIGRYLTQQSGQHRSICHAVVGDLIGPYLQRIRVNPQVYLAPLAPLLGLVLLAFPVTLAQILDASAVHEQVQRRGAGT